ncbi:hypothetical protein [Pseudophaeobacter flagellatus]|uniref:hypothetical protein n=1 Tax=Pseudophaeobacter flagellatus TaxID=2899119 RepID=UPI001E5AAD16|nr:hypothetical protein [Pseudophaeobacter flagellatus]MCD9148258.1 hypothetical protein [Pseudophaeobacter flagellatus]
MNRRIILTTSLAILMAGLSALPAAALDRRVTIVNDTNYTIMKFYGSNKGTDSWEEDILGRDVLRPGQSVRIDFDDGTGYCKFDFRAVFDDDDVLVAKDINVCKIGTYTYN